MKITNTNNKKIPLQPGEVYKILTTLKCFTVPENAQKFFVNKELITILDEKMVRLKPVTSGLPGNKFYIQNTIATYHYFTTEEKVFYFTLRDNENEILEFIT